MRRVIISPAQLKMINEEMSFQGEVDASSEPEMRNLAQNISNTQTGGTAIVANTAPTATQNGTGFYDPNMPIEQQEDFKKFKNIAVATTNESRFSKRLVELARLLEMRKNGKVFSKRQLNEMFMETQENAERLRREIGKYSEDEILDAIEEVFPEEFENAEEVVGNSADLTEFLCSLFSKEGVDSDREEEFLDMLGI